MQIRYVIRVIVRRSMHHHSSPGPNRACVMETRMIHCDLLDRLERFARKRRERARLIAELDSYSDNELNDLGISRVDIPDLIDASLGR